MNAKDRADLDQGLRADERWICPIASSDPHRRRIKSAGAGVFRGRLHER